MGWTSYSWHATSASIEVQSNYSSDVTSLKRSFLSHHTTAEDAGRVAQSAGVKTLVLSHPVPPEDPAVTNQMRIDAARVHFRGRVIVGKDLLEI
jgi:ribonuclease BN (tRNA processing enzyme)